MNQGNIGSERAASSPGERGMSAKSHEAAEHLKESLVDQVEQARERAESAKEDVAERIRRVASGVRDMGDSLRADDALAASLASRAGQRMDGLARYVSQTDARGFARDTEQLARRQPALFFGGAFLLGLTAGRFFRSSGPGDGEQLAARREEERDGKREATAGFMPPPGEGSSSNPQRYRENYDAAFGRDAAGRSSSEPRRQSGSGAPPPLDAPTSPEASPALGQAGSPAGARAPKGSSL